MTVTLRIIHLSPLDQPIRLDAETSVEICLRIVRLKVRVYEQRPEDSSIEGLPKHASRESGDFSFPSVETLRVFSALALLILLGCLGRKSAGAIHSHTNSNSRAQSRIIQQTVDFSLMFREGGWGY